MGTIENPRKLYGQDFERLREHHLINGALFTDESFPANMNSIGLGLKKEFNTQKIVWRRPSEICKEPHLIVKGATLFDILQSQLGDCWVLSAIGAITFKPRLLDNIIPQGQGYSRSYAGIFHFRLWNLGEWVDVVIDDMLPFLDGKYLSVQPSCENEFWPCLLEKAYAKFLGSYENLHWGNPCDAFMNLTGGLPMTFDLRSAEAHTYWNMISSTSRDTVMACISDQQKPYPSNRRGSGLNNNNPELIDNAPEELHTYNETKNGPKLPENPLLEKGLVERHAYAITNYAKVPFRDGFVKLIQIWNPWGYGEWKGNWNDRSPLWKELREEDRLRLLTIDEDGLFWMSWEDFVKEFSRLIICSQIPDFLGWRDQYKKWYKNTFPGRWTKDNISWNNTDFFSKNPMYSITVTGPDGGVNVVISLIQSSRNRHKFGQWLPIGFLLFELPESQDNSPSTFLTPEKMSSIKSFRQLVVTEMLRLAPGRYGVIPYTTQTQHESSFLFQVFLKSKDGTQIIGSQQSLKGPDIPKHDGIFRNYATQGSKLYAWDLRRLLNDVIRKEYPYLNGAKFTIDGSREILASVDISRKGKLDVETFVPLWKTITQYKDLFSKSDAIRCGYLSLTQFLEITQQAGFSVHKDLLYQLFARYSDPEGKLSFVDYLICTTRLKGVLQTFYALSTDGKGAYVHYEKWIQLMM